MSSIPFPWPPGTIVVCVDDYIDTELRGLFNKPLVRGDYYTIRSIGPSMKAGKKTGEYGVSLCEITGAPYPWGGEYNFNPKRFRPMESTHDEAEYLQSVSIPVRKP